MDGDMYVDILQRTLIPFIIEVYPAQIYPG